MVDSDSHLYAEEEESSIAVTASLRNSISNESPSLSLLIIRNNEVIMVKYTVCGRVRKNVVCILVEIISMLS